jgi:hypothetical protein
MEPQKDTTQKPITIEQLLRLKRLEKPDDHFWERFDDQLHRRMLRTLVNSEPSSIGARFSWLRMRWLQAGVTVACAIAIFGFFIAYPAWNDTSAKSANALASQVDDLDVNAASIASQQVPSSNASSIVVAVERMDFGIGQVANAKPSAEGSFSRDFAASAVRVAAAMPMDVYRVDYVSDSVFSEQAMHARLVY